MSMRDGPVNVSGLAWLAIAIVSALPVFWFGLEKLPEEWLRPEFRLKPIVPFVSLILFLQVLRSVPETLEADRTRWIGVLVVAGAMLMAVVGNFVDVDDFVFFALVPWIAGLVLAAFGLRRGLLFWAPVASLFLMLPLPHFIVDPLHRFLEALASQLAVVLLRLLQVPALIEGQMLDFGIMQLRISDATAGLFNFLPLLLVFCIFATVYRGPAWSRVLPILLAAPTLVAFCSLRLALLGIVVNRLGPDAAERFLDWTGQWVLLLASASLLLGLVLGVERVLGNRSGLTGRFDVDLGDTMSQIGRLFQIRPTPQLISVALMTAGLSVIFVVNPVSATNQVHRDSFRLFPPEVAGWSGSFHDISSDTAEVLGADDYVLVDYYSPDEPALVSFWSAYYKKTGANRSQLHSPEACLPRDGWNILSNKPTELPAELHSGKGRIVNKAIIAKGAQKAMVYYWFQGRGRTIASEREAKLIAKYDGVVKGRTDGALVRFITPILQGEDESVAEARITRLMKPILGRLPQFIPD
jgi:exosortase D (VPLPA-CTERM-specific)